MNAPQPSPWAELIRRAVEDPDFRESLIADPRTTITDATGIELPDNVEIVVLEDTATRIHVVLPDANIDLDGIEASGGWGEWGRTCMCLACFEEG